MNKKVTLAATSNERERELKVVLDDQTGRYLPNMHCCAILAEAMPDWMPPRIFFHMADALRGHSKNMAMLMTQNLIGFMSGCGRRLTGIAHVDDQLLGLYKEIYEFAYFYDKKLESLF